MNGQKSKKMVATEMEIEVIMKKTDEFIILHQKVADFEAKTGEGRADLHGPPFSYPIF